MTNKINRFMGIAATILAIMFLESTEISYRLSTIFGIFAMLIIFSIYKGGILSGVGSTIITILYMYNLRRGRVQDPSLYDISHYEFLLDILSMICIGVLAGIMQYRYISYYERFKESCLFASRAEEISDIMICNTSPEGKYIKVPQNLCSLLGYTKNELFNKHYWDVTHPEDAALEEELFHSLISGHKETYSMEKRAYKKNGELIWLFCNVSAVKNNDGEIIYLLRYLVDITEQKIMREELKNKEKELRRSENKYRNLVELSPDAVIIHEGDTITFVNNTGVKLLGELTAEDVTGKSLYEFIHPDYVYNVKSQIGRACVNLNQAGMPFDVKIISHNRIETDVEMINIGFNNGNDIQVMAIIRDITERKRSEELKMAMKENERLLVEAKEYDRIKNEFFANISHELRTPLNVILGTLQLLDIHNQNGSNNDLNLDKYIGLMKQNCYRLLRLVTNIIDITKIDAGYFDVNLESYNIVSIIEDITLSVSGYIEDKGLSLEFDTDTEEKIIKCDPDQMERIMLNLISNAVKFTKPGGKISVKLNDKGSSISISIKDTGIGIPEDKQGMIFERFRQVNKSLTRDHEGSGIGLSLVKSLVEIHGGTIYLVSEPGCGSEFIIELPTNESYESHKKEQAAKVRHIERIQVEFSDIYS